MLDAISVTLAHFIDQEGVLEDTLQAAAGNEQP
jgi:hypothetical protein